MRQWRFLDRNGGAALRPRACAAPTPRRADTPIGTLEPSEGWPLSYANAIPGTYVQEAKMTSFASRGRSSRVRADERLNLVRAVAGQDT